MIEKQLAIQQERTRIAGEMHDDPGSGLTTIKYLSDKALHNLVKHSGANFAEIEVTLDADLNISIKDNGDRMHEEEDNGSGNGLYNIKAEWEK